MLFAKPPQPKQRVFLRRKPDLTAPAQRIRGHSRQNGMRMVLGAFYHQKAYNGECETLGKADWNICNMKEHEKLHIYQRSAGPQPPQHRGRNSAQQTRRRDGTLRLGQVDAGLRHDFRRGQRRYVESLSAYARQFLGKINKLDVDIITGIAPAIAIEQKVNTRNPQVRPWARRPGASTTTSNCCSPARGTPFRPSRGRRCAASAWMTCVSDSRPRRTARGHRRTAGIGRRAGDHRKTDAAALGGSHAWSTRAAKCG